MFLCFFLCSPNDCVVQNDHIEFTVKAAEDLFLVGTQHTELRVNASTNYSCLMQKAQRFHSLFRHYAKYHGLRKDELEYYFVSYLGDNDTPETVQLQRGDVIHVQKKRKPVLIESEANDDEFRADMATLLADDEHKDCVFLVDEQGDPFENKSQDCFSPETVKRKTKPVEIRAHKSVLTARGEYFKGLFRKGCWKETVSPSGESNEATVMVGNEFTKETITRMLEWIYTNRIEHEEDCTAMEILELLCLSDKWLLTDLKRLCEYRLKDMMTVDNVAKMLCATEDFKALRLQKLCVKFIMDNIKAVTQSDLFKEELKAYPHLCIPILQEAASLIPDPPVKKQRMGENGEEEENVVE